MRQQSKDLEKWAEREARTPTLATIMLDFANRPSDKDVGYLTKLAKEFSGKYDSSLRFNGKWFVCFTFSKHNYSGVVEFWNRALLYQDLSNG